jgi:hypothetical protein
MQIDMRIQCERLSFSVLRIIISSFLPTVIDIDNAVRFDSERENDYK